MSSLKDIEDKLDEILTEVRNKKRTDWKAVLIIGTLVASSIASALTAIFGGYKQDNTVKKEEIRQIIKTLSIEE